MKHEIEIEIEIEILRRRDYGERESGMSGFFQGSFRRTCLSIINSRSRKKKGTKTKKQF